MINISLNLQSSSNLNVRNYGISQFQSSSSLQNSVCHYTIPKEDRFINRGDNNEGVYDLPKVIGNGRKAGIGFGGRKFPEVNRDRRLSPSPNHYKLQTFVDKILSNSGISIGERIPQKVRRI
jgi:hypothetical protein